ncbi:MAG TPA: M23 family metallopeptidase [Bacillota bacterium]|jgi:murein DD-endopeptidase MepM/ murein hydrolase activator NlpD
MVRVRRKRFVFTLLMVAIIAAGPGRMFFHPGAGTGWAGIVGRGPLFSSLAAEAGPEEIERESQAIARLIADRQNPRPGAKADGLVWPTPGYTEVTSVFGPRRHPILGVSVDHEGADIAAPARAAVAACGAGRVIAVTRLEAYGLIIVVDHGAGLATVYAHLSAASVKEGDAVERGDRIGLVGSSGQVTGPHLHLEVRRDGEPVDPMTYVRPAKE